jgi:hypothetical protein
MAACITSAWAYATGDETACITSAWAYATGDETGAVLLAGDERRTQQLRMAVAAAASSLLTVG